MGFCAKHSLLLPHLILTWPLFGYRGAADGLLQNEVVVHTTLTFYMFEKKNKVNKKFINVLEVANAEKKEVIIMGDLNCNFSPGASWCQGETKKLKSILQSMSMTQVVNEPTRVTRESQTLILIDSVIDLLNTSLSLVLCT